ncbi:hypothetical protein D3C77_692150 [compost metagenome]
MKPKSAVFSTRLPSSSSVMLLSAPAGAMLTSITVTLRVAESVVPSASTKV